MTRSTRDPLAEFARSLPAALDDLALQELARRLQPYLSADAPPTTADQLYTTAEAAQRAHVNVETVRRAIRAGDLLVSARIGQSPRLSEDAINAWLAGTVEIVGAGAARSARRRRLSIHPEQSLRAAFKNND